MTTEESIQELEKAIEFQFSAMVYVAEDPDKLEDNVDNFLKVSSIRFDGQQKIFVANKQTLELYFEEHVGRLDMELATDVLYIIRGNDPMLLELVGDMSRFEGLWGSFEEYRYSRLEKLYHIPVDGLYYLIVLDGGCDDQEMENIQIWHTFREGESMGHGFLVSQEKEPERYESLTEKWRLTRKCECLFVKRENSVTLDKFRPEYDFVGKFTLDDFGRKLADNFAKRYIISQSFSDIQGEEDYRLVGQNVDSTWQELNADSAILFYNRQQTNFDEFFKSLRDLVQTCKGGDCGDHPGLIEKLQDQGVQMFSINVSFNDLPTFVLDHLPTVLVFQKGKDDPFEIKLKKEEEIVTELMGYLVRQEQTVESEL